MLANSSVWLPNRAILPNEAVPIVLLEEVINYIMRVTSKRTNVENILQRLYYLISKGVK